MRRLVLSVVFVLAVFVVPSAAAAPDKAPPQPFIQWPGVK